MISKRLVHLKHTTGGRIGRGGALHSPSAEFFWRYGCHNNSYRNLCGIDRSIIR